MIDLLNMDCMEYLKDQPANSFDLAIVDPPYGIDAANTFGGEDNKLWVKAVDNETLFVHCSGGYKEVRNQTFEVKVAPLLFIHGVSCIDYNGK